MKLHEILWVVKMVRIIQPGGYSRTNLVRIGLVPHVDEVVVISSPESMTQNELNRIQQAAIDLGSKATYTLHTMPVIGEDATVPQMLGNLSRVKSTLSEKETWISTTGSTNKFVACLFVTFPGHPTITMNRSDDSYLLSDGTTRPLTTLPLDLNWQLLGLRHEKKGDNHHLFSGESLIASPSIASMQGDQLHLEWEMPDSEGKKKRNRVKMISAEIGRLCRLNSEEVYHITIPQKNFKHLDRFPINTRRLIKLRRNSPIYYNNEFFSNYPRISFPVGKQKNTQKCLHIVVNDHDITPTVKAILAHRPCHVVLWKLNVDNTQRQNELDGKTAFLVSYLSGHLLQTLDDLGLKFKNKKISKSKLITEHPLPVVDCKFHLIELNKLSDLTVTLPEEVLACNQTIFDHNSGFPGLHHKILLHLENHNIEAERWITEVDSEYSVKISQPNETFIQPSMNLSSLLLRKHFPYAGQLIRTSKEMMTRLSQILAIIVENSKPNKDKKWKIIEGTFVSKNNEEISINMENGVVFRITYGNGEPWMLGDLGESNIGQWLEDLAAYMIHHFWESRYSIVGLKTLPIKGNATLGETNEIDNYAITKYGTVIGEAKAVSVSHFNSQLEITLGQLMGEIAVIGHRRGQIPIIIIDHLSDQYDDFSMKNGIVVCSWWELQYPDRIIHRFHNKTRTEEDKADIFKRREIESQLSTEGEGKKKERQKNLKSGEREDTNREKAKILFKGFVKKSQISFVEGTERACLISELDVLEGKTIAIAGTKRKILVNGIEKNQDCSGFDIEILDEIPNSLEQREDFFKPSSVYMLRCYPINEENTEGKANLVDLTGYKIKEAGSNQIPAEAKTSQQIERKTTEMNTTSEKTLFSGKVPIDKVERYLDSNDYCIIRGTRELEDGIIAIAKNKYKIFFDPAKKRENWWGYEITVKSTIPEERVSKDIQATGYLENCKIIELDEEE